MNGRETFLQSTPVCIQLTYPGNVVTCIVLVRVYRNLTLQQLHGDLENRLLLYATLLKTITQMQKYLKLSYYLNLTN